MIKRNLQRRTELESSRKNEKKNPIILADQMANSKELQPGGDILSICHALVFRLDGQTREWHDTVGTSKIWLLRTPIVYQIEGRSESTGQVTIKVTLGQNSEYSMIDDDPNCYRLTISPQELYIFRIAADSDSKTFSYVLQNVLRILREKQEMRPEEPPLSPREAWVGEADPPSPRQPISEHLLTSINLGNRIPFASMHASSRHLNPLNPPITSISKVSSSSTPNLSEERTAQNLQTISTINTSALRQTYSPDQRYMAATAVRRSDFEAQIEALCEQLSRAISEGDVNVASQIVTIIAQEQVPLSIKMKNPKVIAVEHGNETIELRVVVEDRETSGGVFVMKVFPSTTIQTLQEEVAERFGFPPKVQKWIIGKIMARPSQTLADCYVQKAGHTAFLYLISGKSAGLTRGELERYVKRNEDNVISALGQQSSNGTVDSTGVAPLRAVTPQLSRTTSMPMLHNAEVPRTEAFASHSVTVEQPTRSLNQSHPINQGEGLNSREQRIQGASNISLIQEELQRATAKSPVMEDDVLNEGHSIPVEDTEELQQVGWTCKACTFINTPTRPGCEVCGGDRPEDYIVPDNIVIMEQERIRIAEERRQQELYEQALQQQEREQAVAREMNFQQLVQTAQQNIIQNTEEFDCAICFTTVLPGDGVVLRECLHCFCRECLREHIRNCTDPEVQCPYQDDRFACHSLITAQEIKSLLSPEDFDKFLNRSLATAESQAANSFHCKTPNCLGWCIYEDNVNIFHCPVCDKQNCLTCKAQHFPEMNCKEYQDDLKRRAQNDKAAQQTQQFLENMITKGDAMRCPQCEIILLKKDGCDWMRCSMCRLEICWATRGPRWGPQGVGDISGGCKCRVGGKKCHPKCQNCH